MTVGIILSNLILGPLKLLMEVIFSLVNRVLDVSGSIIVLSLTVNILVLPLYRRADAIQMETREKEAMILPGIRHIKSVFKGDEQFMILQTYYRQNHYNPLYVLKGILPLLLQLPFFIAAYQFLSRLGCLQGHSLGPIQDLSLPDRIINVGGITLNLLPILMTIINLISGMFYAEYMTAKAKIQLMIMALFFLVLLYHSPAGLVFYWTMNNLFSLVKNLLQKLFPNGIRTIGRKRKLLQGVPRPGLFFLLALLPTILTGFLIPSAVLAASPQEFISYPSDPNPLWYAVNAMLLATGTFVVWGGVYYALGSKYEKRGLEICAWVFFGVSLLNYFFFHNNLGNISSILIYDITPEFTTKQKLINLGVLFLTGAILGLMFIKKENLVKVMAFTIAMAMLGMSAQNLWKVYEESETVYRAQERYYRGNAEIPLSRKGRNVVIFMLDRAVSSYLPCIFYEKPELKDMYSGFVYYPNTLSFGAHTNIAIPALFGGYEYTPKRINERNRELLQDKHNEALLLMPTIFCRQGCQVTVFDAPYPGNYTNAGDYSLYDSLPGVNARKLFGAAETSGLWERFENVRLRNIFCYSLSMIVPTVLYGTVYNMGYYNRAAGSATLFSVNRELPSADYSNMERDLTFLMEYEVLRSLGNLTKVHDYSRDTLLMLDNGATHEQTILQEPEYYPVRNPNNDAYDEIHADRFLAGSCAIRMDTDFQMAHYHVNMAALMLIGDWLTQLKELGVYDNTRIIIVSDHGGYKLFQIEEGRLSESGEDIATYNPLLLVKDFGARGAICTDTSFMTNADVPILAMEDLINNPVNPFTGNQVNNEAKQAIQYVSISHSNNINSNNGTTYDIGRWYAVMPGGETLFDSSRWVLQEEEQ